MNRKQFLKKLCLPLIAPFAIKKQTGQSELLHGKEHIITPKQADKIVGYIKGSDIWLAHQRTNYNRDLKI